MIKAKDLKNNRYNAFGEMAKDINYNILLAILSISVVIEAINAIVDLAHKGYESVSRYPLHLSYTENLFITFMMYVICFLLLKHIYDRYPRAVGCFIMSFLLSQKIILFLYNTYATEVIYFWLFLVAIFAWYYLDNVTSNIAIWISYVLMVVGIDSLGIPIYDVLGLMIIMFLVIIGSSIVSTLVYKRNEQDYVVQYLQQINNQEQLQILNYDQLSGFYTQYGLEQYIHKMEKHTQQKTWIVVMDLDDLTVCNQLYGHMIGDTYIKIFCNLIRFIINTSDDVIGRFGGDEYVAILPSYSGEKEIKEKLDRYNKLLKEEFGPKFHDSRFVPNFSYGLALMTDQQSYRQAYMLGDQARRRAKQKSKRLLSENNFYKPYINYASLFNVGHIIAGVWLDTKERPLVFVTENIEELLGVSSQRFMDNGNLYYQLIHPDDAKQTFSEIRESLDKQLTSFEQTYRLMTESGDYVWVRNYNVPVYENGKVLQINGYLYDITAEIETEELLQTNSQRLNDIIEATNVGTWEWDVARDQVHCSEGFAKMIGEKLEALERVNLDWWLSRIHPDDVDNFYSNLYEHMNGLGEVFEVEYRLRHKEERWIWIYSKGRVIKYDKEGLPALIVGSQTDMTDIKGAEALLQHNEKLSALGRLSGGIAHDMNNQLMIISGLIDLALTIDTKDAYRKHMETISQVSEKASDVVKQLLAFTKHHLFEQKPTDINQLLENMVGILDHTFKKAIDITLEVSDQALYIRGDSSLLENAFNNLCINAKDAMPGGGLLTITTKPVSLQVDMSTYSGHLPKGDYIQVDFHDTGIGIEEDELTRIFEPLYTTKDTGSGIGLSTVISVVAEHKGGVNVESRPKKGTVFRVYLPAIESMDVTPDTDKTVYGDVPNLSLQVMVVDDESIICQVISEFLELNGCSVMPFTHPEDALKAYEKLHDHIDVVILDMLMPVMNGDELFEHMHRIDPHVQVLFVSGYSEGLEVSDAIKKNIIGFIDKPVKMKELHQVLVEGVKSNTQS